MKPRLTERLKGVNVSLLAEFNPHTNYLRSWKEAMHFVYLLQSKKDNDLYIGFTDNLEQRIKQHNSGSVPSTKLRKPFELVYFEGYKSEKDARYREQNLKLRSRAYAQLKKRIAKSLSK
jgi:putative endonuclease